MTVTRHGKCDVCNIPCSITNTFIERVDMFDAGTGKNLSADLSVQIKAWRKKLMYCAKHKESE